MTILPQTSGAVGLGERQGSAGVLGRALEDTELPKVIVAPVDGG